MLPATGQLFQRTVPDASELFEPLENAIRDQLIPALVGREVGDAERQILALPLSNGGLGLTDLGKLPKQNMSTPLRSLINSQPKSTLKSSILTTTPQTSSSPDTHETEYDKRKMKKNS